MVLAKKQLSKVVAIVLVAMCAVAFMPMLNGEAFAAAKVKKPTKVTIQSVKQVSKTTKVKVTWKKATNAKTYNIKIDKKVVKKNYKKQTFTSAALKAGKHKVYVQAVNGKVKGAWSKAKAVTVKPLPAKAEINGIPVVGEILTAKVYDKNGNELTSGVTYQWYRTGANTGGDNPIAGATSAEYKVVAADVPYPLYVTAKAVGKEVKAAETAQVKYVENVTYYVALSPTAVKKGHTAPVVGDVVGIGVKYDGEIDPDDPYADFFDSYQWYADGVAITGATNPYYEITKYEVGKAITAKMVRNHADGTSEEFEAEASAKVVESTLPTAAKITGMTVETEYNADGTVKKAGTPAVGDTLKVEFTEPAGAVDDKATYQWTRGGAAISGATSATYTVKQADFGKELTCIVTNADGNPVAFAPNAINSVANNIGSATVTVSPAAPALETATTAVVKMGTTTLATTDYTAAWYIDSVADANLITNASNKAVTSLEAGAQYYVNKKATALVGHKLIVVAEGAGTYVGTAQSAATAAMTANVTDVEIAADTDKTTAATTLTASVAIGDAPATVAGEPDVKYQWSKKATADGQFVDIAGATKATFAPTEADQVANVIAYKVTITGTDVYKVASANAAVYDCDWDDPANLKEVTINVENTTEAERAATPVVGDVLKAKASVASAEGTMTYTWTLMNGATKVEEKTGASYTIPKTAKKDYVVEVTAANTDASYELYQYTDTITVQGLITAVELVSDGTVLSNYLPTGNPIDDHVANPQVGDVLAANVTAEVAADSTEGITKGKTGYTFEIVESDAVAEYQWYANGQAIAEATGSTYEITAADLGKKLSVEVTGAEGYIGAEKASVESGAVVAYGSIALYAGEEPVEKNSQLRTGWFYTVYVVDANGEPLGLDNPTITVTNSAGEQIDIEDGTFTLDNHSLGKTIEIKVKADGLAEAEAGDLTWSTDLEVVEGYVPAP